MGNNKKRTIEDKTASRAITPIDFRLIENELLKNADKLEAFVHERLDMLKESSEPKSIGLLSKHNPHNGFLHPDSIIRNRIIAGGEFRPDFEVNTYALALEQFIKDRERFPQLPFERVVAYTLTRFVGEYFGNVGYSEHVNEQNAKFWWELQPTLAEKEAGRPTPSLSAMKGKAIAVCIEKATLAQNIGAFLGADIWLVFSENCDIDQTGYTYAHAYNLLLSAEGNYFILDTTNRIVCHGKDGKLYHKAPLFPLTAEQHAELAKGNQVQVKLEFKLPDGEHLTVCRTYGGWSTRPQNLSA